MLRQGKDAVIITNRMEFNLIVKMFEAMGAKNYFNPNSINRVIKEKGAIAWNFGNVMITYCEPEYWKNKGYDVSSANRFIPLTDEEFEIL